VTGEDGELRIKGKGYGWLKTLSDGEAGRQGYEILKEETDDSKTLEKEEYHEIFRILKKNSVEYSENSNGIFFDINTVSDEILDKLVTFMELCKTQRSEEKKRNAEMESIRTKQLKDTAH
jgi:hypothetical protein